VLSGLGGVAFPAVYRLVAAWLKRDFSLFAALAASRGIHLSRAAVVVATAFIAEALISSGRAAWGTTLGLIGEALGCEELLLFSSKGEGFSAIGTLDGFLCVTH
jgi:hypothetical protein